MRGGRPDALALAYLAVALYLGALLVLPLARLLGEAAWFVLGTEQVEPGLYSLLWRLTWRSALLASTVSLASVALALPLALVLTKLTPPGSRALLLLLTLPLVTPPFLSGFATILLLGKTGVITQLLVRLGFPEFSIYGFPALFVTHLNHFVPLALLTIMAGLRVVPRQIEEAAFSLGSKSGKVVVRILIPFVAPYLLMAGLLVFLASFGDVGAPLLVGGNYQVLALETYTSFVSFMVNPQVPVVLGAWSIFIAVALLFFARKLMARTAIATTVGGEPFRYDAPRLRIGGGAVAWMVGGLLFLPYLAILVASLATVWGSHILPDGYTLEHYRGLWEEGRPLQNSLLLSLVATPIAVTLAVLLGKMGRDLPRLAALLDYAALLPFVIPGVVIGIGLIKLYGNLTLFGLAIPLVSSGWALALSYSVRRLPYGMRVMAAAYTRIDRSLEECSESLGASGVRTFRRVTLPQLVPAIAAASTIVFVRIITELGSTLVLYPPGWETLTVSIYSYVVEGYISRAAAIAVLMATLVVTLSALSAIPWRALKERLLGRLRPLVPEGA